MPNNMTKLIQDYKRADATLKAYEKNHCEDFDFEEFWVLVEFKKNTAAAIGEAFMNLVAFEGKEARS